MSDGSNSEAMAVLRDVWTADGRGAADIAHLEPTGKICKNTAMLGIKGMDDEGMANALRSEWRKQLANEGKLSPGSRSIGDEFNVSDCEERGTSEEHKRTTSSEQISGETES